MQVTGGHGPSRPADPHDREQNDHVAPFRRARPREPRLARFLPQLLVRRLLRSLAHGLGPLRVINEDRVEPGMVSARTSSRHGDRELRPRRGAGAQGQHGHGLDHRAGDVQRMSAGKGRAAQRVQSVARAQGALPADLDRTGGTWHRALVRAGPRAGRSEAWPPGADRRAGGLGCRGGHSPGRATLRHAARRRRARHAPARLRTPRVRARGPGRVQANGKRSGAGDAARFEARPRSPWSAARRPRCWCSTCPERFRARSGPRLVPYCSPRLSQPTQQRSTSMTAGKDWAALVGRILLGIVFIPAGFGKIGGFAGTAGTSRAKGCRCRKSARHSRSPSRSSRASRSWSAGRLAGRRSRLPCSRWPQRSSFMRSGRCRPSSR